MKLYKRSSITILLISLFLNIGIMYSQESPTVTHAKSFSPGNLGLRACAPGAVEYKWCISGTNCTDPSMYTITKPIPDGCGYFSKYFSTTTTYWVSAIYADGSESAKVPVTANIISNSSVSKPDCEGKTWCSGPASLTLKASSSWAEKQIWYTSSSGFDNIGTYDVDTDGKVEFSSYFSTTTTYYVACVTANGSESGRTPVTATIGISTPTTSPPGQIIFSCHDDLTTLSASVGDRYQWKEKVNGSLRNIIGETNQTFTPEKNGIYVVDVTTTCGTLQSLPEVEVTIFGSPQVTVTANPGLTVDYGTSINLTANGATSYSWSPSEHFNTSTGQIVICSPTETATFTVTGSEHGCSGSAEFDIIVNFTIELQILGSQYTVVPRGGKSPYSYKWYNGKTTQSIPLPGIGSKCWVEVTDADGQKLRKDLTVPFANAQSMNYIFTRTPREKMQSIPDNYTFENITGVVQYFDGLGRALQTVAIEANPDKLSIIQPIDYDIYGREKFKYLPYVAADGSGLYRDKTEWESAQPAFYNGLLPGQNQGNYAKAETDFEESPLNRVLRQGGVGQQWQMGQGHEKHVDYETNGSDIIKWEVTGDVLNKGLISKASANNGFYPLNTLTVLKTIDENGHWRREYKDITGKVVLIESMPLEGEGIAPLRNYYVYDDLGNLRCVIPPEADAVGYDDDEFDEFCYYYKYDDRNRPIEKKIPGAGTFFMVYDKRDRLVLTQDGNLRSKSPKQWLVTKYENNFNRPVITGILEDNRNRVTLQTDEFDDDLTFAFPAEADIEVLSRTYYDSYNNISFNLGNYGFEDAFGLNNRFDKLKGLVVATITKVIETGEELKTVNYYDDKYRVIQTTGDNHMGGKDVISNRYDFTGQLVETKQAHYKNDKTNVTNSIDKELSYDDAGRLQTVAMKLNTELALHTIAKYNYNPLGQLIEKKYHQLANESFLFSTTNTYNINGWLKNLNSMGGGKMLFDMNLYYEDGNYPKYNGNISRMTWNSSKLGEVKTYNYNYDELDRIKEASYSSAGDDNYNTQYNYDKNGNIETLVRYGLMGSAGYGLIDNLTYTYNGNRLLGVNDRELPNQQAYGFSDKGTRKDPVSTDISTHEYLYDANGNMKTDLNKEINRVEYNYLNLPDFILFKGNENAIEYHYDAAGQKVRQIVRGTFNKQTDYVGNFVYENGSLAYILTDDGRLVPNGTGFTYEYFIKDHLGNTRVTLANKGGTAEVMQENHYYPFGLQLAGQSYNNPLQNAVNRITFQGQEEQDEYDLGWHHFKWRMHSPEIGRFMCVDPLAEKYYYNSTYAFSENKVINAIELEGLESIDLGGSQLYNAPTVSNIPDNFMYYSLTQGQAQSFFDINGYHDYGTKDEWKLMWHDHYGSGNGTGTHSGAGFIAVHANFVNEEVVTYSSDLVNLPATQPSVVRLQAPGHWRQAVGNINYLWTQNVAPNGNETNTFINQLRYYSRLGGLNTQVTGGNLTFSPRTAFGAQGQNFAAFVAGNVRANFPPGAMTINVGNSTVTNTQLGFNNSIWPWDFLVNGRVFGRTFVPGSVHTLTTPGQDAEIILTTVPNGTKIITNKIYPQ